MSNEDHPEVQAAKIQARAIRQTSRLAAVTALLGVCIAGTCTVANTAVSVALQAFFLHPEATTPVITAGPVEPAAIDWDAYTSATTEAIRYAETAEARFTEAEVQAIHRMNQDFLDSAKSAVGIVGEEPGTT